PAAAPSRAITSSASQILTPSATWVKREGFCCGKLAGCAKIGTEKRSANWEEARKWLLFVIITPLTLPASRSSSIAGPASGIGSTRKYPEGVRIAVEKSSALILGS